MRAHPCRRLAASARRHPAPWVLGLAALAWVLVRSIPKPSRLTYPCQRAALSTSWAFLGVPVIAGAASARWRRPVIWTAVTAGVLWVALALGGRVSPPGQSRILGSASITVGEADASTPAALAATPDWLHRESLFPGRVVHVHDADATSWDFATGWYGDYVNQDVVTAMVTAGLLELTGTRSAHDAWEILIPDFEPGQKLVIKINLNNAVSPPTNAIDAMIEPVNALLGGLIEYGFAASDLTVYDVTHAAHNGIMPARLTGGCDYPGVNFVAYVGNPAPYSATEKVHFTPPSGPGITDRPIATVLAEADYLIDLPVAKVHDYAGMSLSFKNHFGSIDHCDYLHNYVFPSYPYYSASYNPLVELYMSPHIGGKTVLILCDCLYGNYLHLYTPPSPWPSFGNDAPNSVFLATDPVALDCVVADYLDVDGPVPATADDYLVLAAAQGLGVFERSAPPGNYSLIDYERLEPPFAGTGVPDDAQPAGEAHGEMTVTPNPATGEILVSVDLAERRAGPATLSVFNCQGRLVRTLLDDRPVDGHVEAVWDGTGDDGQRVASGVYWLSLRAGGVKVTRKVTLVR